MNKEKLKEALKENKKYKVQNNIGASKYVVSYYNGQKKHNDGSEFYDIKIFKNQKDLIDFEKELKYQGYNKEY